MKKKLLVIVGAGASVEFGLPSVSGVDSLFDTFAGTNFPLVGGSNLYAHFRDVVDKYYLQNPKPALAKKTNFEEVLYLLNFIASNLVDPNFERGSASLIVSKSLPDLSVKSGTLLTNGDDLRNMSQRLMDLLVEEFINRCAKLPLTKRNEINEVQKLLDTLSADFELGIFTLNYDNVFSLAQPSLFTGFNDSTGKFDPVEVGNRTAWDFIYHLHGSIHFQMTGDGSDLHGITWESSPAYNHKVQSYGRNSQFTTEGTDFPISTFVAGYGKTSQTLRQPYRTYLSQFNRAVNEADSVLFAGYGFGDQHINTAFTHIRSRRRPIVVLDFAADTQDPLPFRADVWTHNLALTVHTDLMQMAAPGAKSAAFLGELKAKKEFEVSKDTTTPLAVWYDGFLSACHNSAKVLTHLK